jgi:hypothetical protein
MTVDKSRKIKVSKVRGKADMNTTQKLTIPATGTTIDTEQPL